MQENSVIDLQMNQHNLNRINPKLVRRTLSIPKTKCIHGIRNDLFTKLDRFVLSAERVPLTGVLAKEQVVVVEFARERSHPIALADLVRLGGSGRRLVNGDLVIGRGDAYEVRARVHAQGLPEDHVEDGHVVHDVAAFEGIVWIQAPGLSSRLQLDSERRSRRRYR